MRYLITTKEVLEPFRVNSFNYENHYIHNSNMVVYDLLKNQFTINGIDWLEIETDLF